MKVSMLGTLPPIKGVSPYTYELLKELSKIHEVDFYGFKSIYPEFMYPGGTKTNEQQPTIKNVNINNNLTWYNPLSWIKAGFSINTDIIHAQWWSWVLAPVYFTTLSIARLRGKKIIMTVHNVRPHEKSFVKNYLNKSVISLAQEYIVHSEDNKSLFLTETNTKKPIHILPHGLIEFVKSNKSEKALRKKYGFSIKDKVLIFFGNIRPYKGLDNLLVAISKISDKNVKLVVAGKPWEEFDDYQSIINSLNLRSRIKLFLEYLSQEKVAELFKLSDVAVFPYKEFEASSGAGAVALNYEKAMVVTNAGGLTEIVKDKRVIAKPNNIESLKESIIYALKNTSKLSKESKNLRKDFSWKNISAKTSETYEKD